MQSGICVRWNGCAAGIVCLMVLVLPAASVRSNEVVVKIDSIVDGSTATICPCFVGGECAAVWLTSPCNGHIVAVQVFWRSLYGGQPQSLEDSITVYAAGTFPTPGAILQNDVAPYNQAFFEGPVLSDGVLNEFRYLDEYNTIRLHVPISSGQQFVVSLKFYNTNNEYPWELPSVVFDADGCQAQKNTVFAIPGGWTNACDLGVSGDWMIRAVVDCTEPTGACCHANGTCESGKQQSECQVYGDVWTQGSTCAQVTCTARGACCVGGGCLPLATQANCQGATGVYAGNGTKCSDQVCVAGACCLATGECVLNFGVQCTALGGTFRGPGTSCTPNPCPQPTGACCLGQICFPDQTEADCTGATGTWVGASTDCGPPTPCVLDPCASVSFTPGDANDDGVIDGLDVQGFVGQYLNPTPGSVAFCAANMCAADQAIDDSDLAAFVACLLDPTTCGDPSCP